MKPQPQKWRSPGMISSLSVEWRTPQNLFDLLDAEFRFAIDVTPMEGRPLRDDLGQLVGDALALPSWPPGPVWMNSPYGKALPFWLERAHREALNGNTVVALIPARTDTAWWHDYVMGREIRFLRGRLTFRRPNSSSGRCPFPSAIVIFRPEYLRIDLRADTGVFQQDVHRERGRIELLPAPPRRGILARIRSLFS